MIDSVPGLIFILFRQLSDPVLGEGYGNTLMRGGINGWYVAVRNADTSYEMAV